MKLLIQHGTIVNENNIFDGSIIVEDSKITKIVEGNTIPDALDSTGRVKSISHVEGCA
jgi:dihydroorotase